STHRDLQVSGELQESICRNKTTAYLLNAIPLPLQGSGADGHLMSVDHIDPGPSIHPLSNLNG
ncbi:hypothetical protein, partial [Sinorhizobium meliloti]